MTATPQDNERGIRLTAENTDPTPPRRPSIPKGNRGNDIGLASDSSGTWKGEPQSAAPKASPPSRGKDIGLEESHSGIPAPANSIVAAADTQKTQNAKDFADYLRKKLHVEGDAVKVEFQDGAYHTTVPENIPVDKLKNLGADNFPTTRAGGKITIAIPEKTVNAVLLKIASQQARG